MPFYSIPNPLVQALTLLEQFETGTATGAMAVPFVAINRINALLEYATSRGDCIAPYFLNYMYETGYYSVADRRELPDLTQVPSHRAKGDVWVRAYRLYLQAVTLYLCSTEPSVKVVRNERHARLILTQAQKEQRNSTRSIANLVEALLAIDHPIAHVFMGKYVEKSSGNLSIAEASYRYAAFYPNVWGLQEYWNFLQRNPSFRTLDAPTYSLLEKEFAILQNAHDNWESLLEYHKSTSNVQQLQRWLIHATLHGEAPDPMPLITAYLRPNTSWVYPISSQEALVEAIKWFDWIQSKRQDDPFFLLILKANMENLLSEIDQNTLEMNLFLLKLCEYVLREKENFLYLTENIIEVMAFVMQVDEDIKKLSHVIYLNNPQHPMLKESELASVALGIYFELQSNHRLAEYWYRNALRLMPDNIVFQYNLANILYKQAKELPTYIELFLKAAEGGCQDSLYILLGLIFRKNCLSDTQIGKCIEIIQTNMPPNLRAQPDQTDSTTAFLVIPWLERAREYKLYKSSFRVWKKWAEEQLVVETAKKEQLLQEMLASHSMRKKTSTELQIHQPSFTDDEVEEEDGVVVDMDQEGMGASSDELTVEKRMSRASDMLQALSEKPMRHLTLRDRITVQRCLSILLNAPGVQLSNKGRTSGSRMAINGETVHVPHGRDRMSPGAQQGVKRHIEKAMGYQLGSFTG